MDYGLFSRLKGNRDINLLHADRLEKSISEESLVKPIDVNEDYEIIDGQHRFHVWKKLGQPVYYIKHDGWGIKQAHRLNANQKNWSMSEYLDGYCELGMVDYLLVRELYQKFNEFPFMTILSAAAGVKSKASGEVTGRFKRGAFKVGDIKNAERILDKLRMIKPYYDGYNKAYFALAVFEALDNKEFCFQGFLSKLAFQSTKLVDCTNKKQYLMSIEDIYNFKRRNDEKIRLF